MSLDDYINRVPNVPPKVDFTEQQSSLDEDYPPLDPGRVHITNSLPANRPGNSTIPRFTLGYWTAQENGDAVATVVPTTADRLLLSASFRTNKDRSALLWSSKDTLAHQVTSYVENINYQNLVLAFQHDTPTPDNFTATITNNQGSFLYRLVPYALNATTNRYECLDKKFGTNNTYPATVYDRTKTNINGVAYQGSTNYIFILDFNAMRQGHDFSGGLIDPRKISSIALDVLPLNHALGADALVARIIDLEGDLCQMELGGVQDTAKISAGDVISGLLTYITNSDTLQTRNTSWVVVDSTGFGSSNRTVTVQGVMPGGFIDFQFAQSRDLQEPSVIAQVTAGLLFGNFTLTGTGVRTMSKRTYAQAVNGLAMVSDLDNDHKMQPKRLVDSVVALGYRQDWNLSLGSKSYFQGTTTLKAFGSGSITESESHQWPVLYAGEAQLNGHYVVGRAPGRGIDMLHDGVNDLWEDNFASILTFNGTTRNSSAEAAAMPVGGSYWWDLELDLPGPALLAAVAAMRGRTPQGVVWCLGDSDAVAIDSPGNRMPAPTVARAKAATIKIFAYFRTLWGSALPIWIQEQAWGWVGTDPTDPSDPGTNVPIQKGAPTYLRARRTAFGDLLLEWKSYDLDPSLASYRVEIYNPVKIGTVLHSFTVPGTQQENDYIYADWSVEDNGPIRALVDTGNDYWGGLRWRVVAVSALGQVPSVTKSGLVPIDNTLVERVIVCGPNLYSGNYFTAVSDPLHGFSRRFAQAQTIMRTEYALKAGLRRLKVMPIDVSDEDRGDEDSELEDMKFGRILTDWWNLDLGFPGASLVAATAKVLALGRPVAHWMMAAPGETELMRTMQPTDIMIMLGKLRDANVAMLNFVRTVWGNPNLCMWLQGASSIWMGIPGVTPYDINGVAAAATRDSQSRLCLDSPDFFLGTYVPGSDAWQNYQAVGLERKYFTPEVFYAAAREMGESMAVPIDRARADGDCPDMVLTLNPQYGPWGTGWYALYAAVNNGGVYSPAGEVNIPNKRLAYALVADTGPVYQTFDVTGAVYPVNSDQSIYEVTPSSVEPPLLTGFVIQSRSWAMFNPIDPEAELQYTDNSLQLAFSGEDASLFPDVVQCKIYDESAGGVLVYDKTLYLVIVPEGNPLHGYVERPGVILEEVPNSVYPYLYAEAPYNFMSAYDGHVLRFHVEPVSGAFPYYSRTSVAIWGNEDEPLETIKLSKNGGAPVSLVPSFELVALSPEGYTGQWRADQNTAVFTMDDNDTLEVTLPDVCDHDTGPGCDNPVIITVEGWPYDVTPTNTYNDVVIGPGEWVSVWNSGAAPEIIKKGGSISPYDFQGGAAFTNGAGAGTGNVLLPGTTIYRIGNGDEGFTHAVVQYNGVSKTFPLTWIPISGTPGGNGIWSYNFNAPQFDMSGGGPFELTFFGGIAQEREIEVCGPPPGGARQMRLSVAAGHPLFEAGVPFIANDTVVSDLNQGRQFANGTFVMLNKLGLYLSPWIVEDGIPIPSSQQPVPTIEASGLLPGDITLIAGNADLGLPPDSIQPSGAYLTGYGAGSGVDTHTVELTINIGEFSRTINVAYVSPGSPEIWFGDEDGTPITVSNANVEAGTTEGGVFSEGITHREFTDAVNQLLVIRCKKVVRTYGEVVVDVEWPMTAKFEAPAGYEFSLTEDGVYSDELFVKFSIKVENYTVWQDVLGLFSGSGTLAARRNLFAPIVGGDLVIWARKVGWSNALMITNGTISDALFNTTKPTSEYWNAVFDEIQVLAPGSAGEIGLAATDLVAMENITKTFGRPLYGLNQDEFSPPPGDSVATTEVTIAVTSSPYIYSGTPSFGSIDAFRSFGASAATVTGTGTYLGNVINIFGYSGPGDASAIITATPSGASFLDNSPSSYVGSDPWVAGALTVLQGMSYSHASTSWIRYSGDWTTWPGGQPADYSISRTEVFGGPARAFVANMHSSHQDYSGIGVGMGQYDLNKAYTNLTGNGMRSYLPRVPGVVKVKQRDNLTQNNTGY